MGLWVKEHYNIITVILPGERLTRVAIIHLSTRLHPWHSTLTDASPKASVTAGTADLHTKAIMAVTFSIKWKSFTLIIVDPLLVRISTAHYSTESPRSRSGDALVKISTALYSTESPQTRSRDALLVKISTALYSTESPQTRSRDALLVKISTALHSTESPRTRSADAAELSSPSVLLRCEHVLHASSMFYLKKISQTAFNYP